MTIQRSRLSVLATLLLAAGLSFGAQAQTATQLKIGTFGGPFEQVTDAAARAGKRLGLDITPVIFSNAVLPNEALVGNEIDGNAYQHTVYLNAEVRRRGFKIVQAAEIYTVPLAIYSAKHKSLADLPKGARIAIPSDEANQGRALLALQDHGLVKIKAGLDRSPSLLEVAENPKDIKFLELAVPAVPKALPDVDAIAVNANVAHQQASLTLKQAIAVEKAETTKRYTQLLVIREADKDKPWVPTLVSAYRSPEVRQLIETQFKDVMTPAF
ncbi:MetQ/NlpA family ABC transporter substrate-binding protein [Pseudorhodoferax sp.]|uniref:MetQ/NlpA family ABC transporter substrate-binding protein n=1 Tax=Pseudorhodoferax sp. TaxID=1993553 RepID=UPI002DD68066|nr:MetQ/NlpA family ABC transporter substrate-binding protein [Pseudorhodoferax sp.]